jgi:hypothetical protein
VALQDLKPGYVVGPEFQGSMAQAIEIAFNELQPEASKLAPDESDPATIEHRKLFVAIARGVVRHLAANPGAFVVNPQADHAHDISIRKTEGAL